jgi:hypothetical protein
MQSAGRPIVGPEIESRKKAFQPATGRARHFTETSTKSSLSPVLRPWRSRSTVVPPSSEHPSIAMFLCVSSLLEFVVECPNPLPEFRPPVSLKRPCDRVAFPRRYARSGRRPACAYRNRAGTCNVLAVGHFVALVAIPQSLSLDAVRDLNPWAGCRRDRLTIRRADAVVDHLGGARLRLG